MTKTSAPRPDLYAEVLATLEASMNAGVVPWHKNWSGTVTGLPRSMSTGHVYRGINVFLLGLVADAKGYGSAFWGTYRQIAALGGQVRKDEKGTRVYLAKPMVKKVEDAETGEETERRWWMLKCWTVFNADQADGLPERFAAVPDTRTEPERLDAAEAMAAGYLAAGPSISFGGDRAYYSPSADAVRVPSIADFETVPGYYSTLFHELGHSTGHASRLNRPGIADHSARFGDPVYSQEELVAEMTAAMLCAVAGIPQDAHIPASAAYLAGWLKVLKGDPKMLVVAASQAHKAADLIAGTTAAELADDEADVA